MKRLWKIAALAVIALFCGLGCAIHDQTQSKYYLGADPKDREPVQQVDFKTGEVKYVAPKPPIMDLGRQVDDDGWNRETVAGGAVTNPQRQKLHWEKRTVTETGETDIKGCPLPEQRMALINNGYSKTDTYRSTDILPEEAQPLPVALNTGDGKIMKFVKEVRKLGGNFVQGGLAGLLEEPDQVTATGTGYGGQGGKATANPVSYAESGFSINDSFNKYLKSGDRGGGGCPPGGGGGRDQGHKGR